VKAKSDDSDDFQDEEEPDEEMDPTSSGWARSRP
jgi:hypothetical protein